MLSLLLGLLSIVQIYVCYCVFDDIKVFFGLDGWFEVMGEVMDFQGNVLLMCFLLCDLCDLMQIYVFDLVNWEGFFKVFDVCVFNDCIWFFGVFVMIMRFMVIVCDCVIGVMVMFNNVCGNCVVVIEDMSSFFCN